MRTPACFRLGAGVLVSGRPGVGPRASCLARSGCSGRDRLSTTRYNPPSRRLAARHFHYITQATFRVGRMCSWPPASNCGVHSAVELTGSGLVLGHFSDTSPACARSASDPRAIALPGTRPRGRRARGGRRPLGLARRLRALQCRLHSPERRRARHGGSRPIAPVRLAARQPLAFTLRRPKPPLQLDRPGARGNCERCLAGVDGLVTTNPG